MVAVGGAGSFTTSAADAVINLDTLAVMGTIGLSTSGTDGNATIVNATAVALEPMDIGGDLNVTATTGNLTDDGLVTVGGAGSFTTSAADAVINLDTLAVTGSIDLSTTGSNSNATIVNATAVVLEPMNIGGDLDVTATLGNITDNGAVTVGGAGSFTTSDTDVVINLDTLAVTGPIDLSTSGSDGDATIMNATGVTFNASVVGGTLDVMASTGAITQNTGQTITVGQGASFTTLENDQPITLTDSSNAISGVMTFNTSSASTDPASMGGDVQITNDVGPNTLGLSNIAGDLTVTAQTGILTDNDDTITVSGTGSFTTVANGATIHLDSLAVAGAIDVTTSGSGRDATIVNAAGVTIDTSTVSGELIATATTGAISQVAGSTITASQGASFTTSELDQPITLMEPSNAITGAMTFTTSSAETGPSADPLLMGGDVEINNSGVLGPPRWGHPMCVAIWSWTLWR